MHFGSEEAFWPQKTQPGISKKEEDWSEKQE
jgi:hypothetical protein